MSTVALTCIRDEGPWLLDWIAHHRAAGFDTFVIASHDCTDGTNALLGALDAAGIVEHVPFVAEGPKSYQWQALKKLTRCKSYKSADVAMFFDLDEYLVLDGLSDVRDLLPGDADAVPLRWVFFGHSGRSEWEDLPVTERFEMAAPMDIRLPQMWFYKTLHRPTAFRELGVHRPKGTEARWVSSGGSPLPAWLGTRQSRINLMGIPLGVERAWLNHYSVRSIEEFVLKSMRGLPNRTEKKLDAGYWAERNFNTVEDRRIAPMRAAAQRERAALSPFDELHAATVAHHRARLYDLTKTRPVIDLMWQLELLAGSTPPSARQLSTHQKMFLRHLSENADG